MWWFVWCGTLMVRCVELRFVVMWCVSRCMLMHCGLPLSCGAACRAARFRVVSCCCVYWCRVAFRDAMRCAVLVCLVMWRLLDCCVAVVHVMP